jgi:hypothetical protein
VVVVGWTSAASGRVRAPFVLDPSDGVSVGRFGLAALRGCHQLPHLKKLFVCLLKEVGARTGALGGRSISRTFTFNKL